MTTFYGNCPSCGAWVEVHGTYCPECAETTPVAPPTMYGSFEGSDYWDGDEYVSMTVSDPPSHMHGWCNNCCTTTHAIPHPCGGFQCEQCGCDYQ
jgi:hypothetical protein